MRLIDLKIKNYRSFGPQEVTILFPTNHCVLIGKNNVGKSNILSALDMLFGIRKPEYIKFEENDFFDPAQPLEITGTIGLIDNNDSSTLFSIPGLTQQQKGALSAKISNGTAKIIFSLSKIPESESNDDHIKNNLEIDLWGFTVFKKKEDTRSHLVSALLVPPVRDHKEELSPSSWTLYGHLMKDILRSSQNYQEIKSLLSALNKKIQETFVNEKGVILKNAKIVACVDDIEFRLTKENDPSELLRNLEIFIKEKDKFFNINDVGTGTQNSVIIGILELVLKNRYSSLKIFGIEEPEAFIHPHGQRYIGLLIKSVSSTQNIQVITSTHSTSLVTSFSPNEIIKVHKNDVGSTEIKQDRTLTSTDFKKFINPANAEMLFSDRVLLVEGETERVLFSTLDKYTILRPQNQKSLNCNFDRINLSIITLGSSQSICNYIRLARCFDIKYSAILDNDFVDSNNCSVLCRELGVTYQRIDDKKLISDFKTKNIIILNKGEIEDYIPDSDIAIISGKRVGDIPVIKSKHKKTSSAFGDIFNGKKKPEYAELIANHYVSTKKKSPLDDTIRKLYINDLQNINL